MKKKFLFLRYVNPKMKKDLLFQRFTIPKILYSKVFFKSQNEKEFAIPKIR